MRAFRSIAALVGCLLVALIGLGSVVVAYSSKGQAADSLQQAHNLRDARLKVAAAQEALGGSDIEDAARSGERANAVALRVDRQTDRIAALLRPLSASAGRTTNEGRRGVRATIASRRQTQIAANVLEALAGYQDSAARSAVTTNRALERILEALKKTNRNFP